MKGAKMKLENTGDSHYTILFNKVIEDKNLLPTTRLLAVDISKNGYVNIGDFFQKMPQDDLQKYLNMSEDLDSDDSAEVLLLSEMLAIGEGLDNSLDETAPETMQNRMSQLIMYLACESLARQGLVKLYRENMSFGDDMRDKILVEKI
jgi:hypothetical protein